MLKKTKKIGVQTFVHHTRKPSDRRCISVHVWWRVLLMTLTTAGDASKHTDETVVTSKTRCVRLPVVEEKETRTVEGSFGRKQTRFTKRLRQRPGHSIVQRNTERVSVQAPCPKRTRSCSSRMCKSVRPEQRNAAFGMVLYQKSPPARRHRVRKRRRASSLVAARA